MAFWFKGKAEVPEDSWSRIQNLLSETSLFRFNIKVSKEDTQSCRDDCILNSELQIGVAISLNNLIETKSPRWRNHNQCALGLLEKTFRNRYSFWMADTRTPIELLLIVVTIVLLVLGKDAEIIPYVTLLVGFAFLILILFIWNASRVNSEVRNLVERSDQLENKINGVEGIIQGYVE